MRGEKGLAANTHLVSIADFSIKLLDGVRNRFPIFHHTERGKSPFSTAFILTPPSFCVIDGVRNRFPIFHHTEMSKSPSSPVF
jgi:hypothetical protein